MVRVLFKWTLSKSRLNGYTTEWVEVTSSVPHGSILGPTLFLMYINDLTDALNLSKCLMFADDDKIFKDIKNSTEFSSLQKDIDSMLRWCHI